MRSTYTKDQEDVVGKIFLSGADPGFWNGGGGGLIF